MALELVTVDEALAQIRGDEDADGPWLEIWIPIVSASVLSWLKEEWRLYQSAVDSNGDTVVDSDGNPVPAEEDGEPIVHPSVKGAVLVEIASQNRFREGGGDNRNESMGAYQGVGAHGFVLSHTATALLAGRRKATVA